METLLVLIMLVLLLDIAALHWGFDSTEEIDSPEWERRASWVELHRGKSRPTW